MKRGKKNQLEKICREYSIALLYLFGSQAEKGLEVLSGNSVEPLDTLADLDLGVVFDSKLQSPEQIPKLYSDLYNHLEDIFKPFRLDLVFLQEQHSVFQSEVVLGICIYYESQSYREDFEENIMRRAADFKPFLEKFYQERLEELS